MRTTVVIIFLGLLTLGAVDGRSKKQEKKKNRSDLASRDVTIDYYLYRRSDRSGVRLTGDKVPSDFDRSLPTYVVIHGMGSHHQTPCQKAIRNAFLDQRDANVILPNYTNSSSLYILLYEEVARRMGSFLLKEEINPSNTRIVGASLGAQVAGMIRAKTGFRPKEVYGLDPAGPIFEGYSERRRLNPYSGEYVHAIHTNTGVYGITAPVGNHDVYINGGNDYPCCTTNSCRHGGSCDFFVRTIKNGAMDARQCDSLRQAQSASCKGPTLKAGYGTAASCLLKKSMLGKLNVDALPDDVRVKQQPVWDQHPDENKKSLWIEAIVESARQYCFTTVLHGVKYLAEPRRSHFERFVWSVVLVGLFGIALHLIWITSVSDLSSPLLINLVSSNYPIWNFKFPAVTICPTNKINRSLAEEWARSVKLPPNMTAPALVDLIPSLLHLIDFSNSPTVSQLDEVLQLNNVEAHELYLNLSVPCMYLLVQCRLQGQTIPCKNLFKTMRTTEGYCCSFNYFGVSSQFFLNRYHEVSEATPQTSWRSVSNGVDSGLSVIVRAMGNAYGTLMSSQGLKVLLHVPSNFPDHLSIARLVQPGHSEHFALSPTLIKAESDIRVVPPEQRGCIFFDEKELNGFQEYTYKNCIFNCRVTFFNDLCGCVPFFYPAHQDEIQALRMNLSIDMDSVEEPPCGCSPQCNEISYAVATSNYVIHNHLKTAKYENLDAEQGHAEINVYFKALFGTMYQRVIPSTTYQMLANFGGLLGLFMGFSFTSAFEIIYSFTLRVLFRVYVASQQRTRPTSPCPKPPTDVILVQPFSR